uniref:G_PROTEIN_RECEP_F2_4 domain-containing protein n=1 Tax=Heterorhabditis bacteriophora TaxID=37862 RepID=A0A1I7XAV7_HETBA
MKNFEINAYINPIPATYMVSRVCGQSGDWHDSNYSQCITVVDEFSHCIQGFCRVCPDLLRDLVISVSLTLSIVSVALLVTAILLFSIFDGIQCRRLSIHKNLATAFVFRFAVLAIWTIVQSTNLFQDCTKFNPQPLWDLVFLLLLLCVGQWSISTNRDCKIHSAGFLMLKEAIFGFWLEQWDLHS